MLILFYDEWMTEKKNKLSYRIKSMLLDMLTVDFSKNKCFVKLRQILFI